MKFDCGLTPEEQFANRINWHRWFAWHPVRIGPGDCRWLEYVERKGELPHCDSRWSWSYRQGAK